VKAKPMEALKKLGHEKLKLDEYESAYTFYWFTNFVEILISL
jgi:hypothetical protein